MILAVMVENTNILVGCAEEKTSEVFFEEYISTDIKKVSVEYAILINEILSLHGISPKSLSGGIIASCVPEITDTLKEAMKRLLPGRILDVGPGLKTGVHIKTDDPREVGSDLIAAAAAGIAKYGSPLIIVGLYTLTTLSVIDEGGGFRGVIFMPGIRLASETISKNAARLPDIAINTKLKLIGTNTVESIQSGIWHGSKAAIDGLIKKIRQELHQDNITTLITGVFAKEIASGSEYNPIVDEHLCLDGLMIIYNRNRISQESPDQS